MKPTLFGARVFPVNPKPRAGALVIRARRHICRDFEIRVKVPDACVVHAEYDEVLRLHIIDVRLVGYGQRTTTEIVNSVGMKLSRRLSRAWVIRIIGVLLVTAGTRRPPRHREKLTSLASNNLASLVEYIYKLALSTFSYRP